MVGRTLYDDMQRMEEIVQTSGVNWTVVRPGGLFDAADPTDPRYPQSITEVITRTGIPSRVTFLKEAFGVRRP